MDKTTPPLLYVAYLENSLAVLRAQIDGEDVRRLRQSDRLLQKLLHAVTKARAETLRFVETNPSPATGLRRPESRSRKSPCGPLLPDSGLLSEYSLCSRQHTAASEISDPRHIKRSLSLTASGGAARVSQSGTRTP
eukprot:scaffold965_cov262-Pinguiococcus_pyrenoidosus.AAC.15